MSLSKYSSKIFGENDQALYSLYLKFIIEKLVIYNDLDTNKSTIRKDLFVFLQNQIDQIKFVFKINKLEEKENEIFLGIQIIFLLLKIFFVHLIICHLNIYLICQMKFFIWVMNFYHH